MSRRRQVLSTLLLPVILAVALAACAAPARKSPSARLPKKTAPRLPAAKGGTTNTRSQQGNKGTEVTAPIKVYFASADLSKLVGENRSLSGSGDPAAQAVNMLIAGPSSKDLRPTIPAGTRLLGVEITGKVAYVDFSKEFVDNHPGGSAAEIATVYSIVNTLTALEGIDKVAFKVEGKPLALLKGHLDLTEPLGRDASLLVGAGS